MPIKNEALDYMRFIESSRDHLVERIADAERHIEALNQHIRQLEDELCSNGLDFVINNGIDITVSRFAGEQIVVISTREINAIPYIENSRLLSDIIDKRVFPKLKEKIFNAVLKYAQD